MRNREILHTIEDGGLPVLPFEIDVAKSAMERLVKEQNSLGKSLGEAMNQSSETWHDNAPAEAVSQASITLSALAKPVQHILGRGVIFDYEQGVSEEVTLGSVVSVRFDNSSDCIKYLVTGATREIPEDSSVYEKMSRLNASVITLSSPIGRAIFGAKVGQTVAFDVPKRRQRKVTIDSIDVLR